MFPELTNQSLIKIVLEIYKRNEVAESHSVCDTYFRMGVANALNSLCKEFGIDLVSEVKKEVRDA